MRNSNAEQANVDIFINLGILHHSLYSTAVNRSTAQLAAPDYSQRATTQNACPNSWRRHVRVEQLQREVGLSGRKGHKSSSHILTGSTGTETSARNSLPELATNHCLDNIKMSLVSSSPGVCGSMCCGCSRS